jgi:peptidoglycan/xylan/chitin deacetylase (PgdA/CDA1 family)
MIDSIDLAQSLAKTMRGLPLRHSDRGRADTAGKLVGQTCIFTYHEIQPEDSKYLYHVTSPAFENHLSIISSVPGNSLAGTTAQIAFDDGHRSNYENAFPILERFEWKATFFVLAGCVGNSANYISWEQAREMALAGHHIASHGWSHRVLTHCSSLELERELSGSKHEIEDRLGIEVDSISAPGGRWDERVANACADAGYKCLFHSNPWLPGSSRMGLRLQGRHMVTGRMDSRQLQELMQLRGARRQYLRARYVAKERFRQMLGDRVYHQLWCWLANWNPGEGMELEVDGPSEVNRTAGDSKSL